MASLGGSRRAVGSAPRRLGHPGATMQEVGLQGSRKLLAPTAGVQHPETGLGSGISRPPTGCNAWKTTEALAQMVEGRYPKAHCPCGLVPSGS